MHRSIWVLLICVAPVGCHFEECGDDWDDWDDDHHCGCDDEHDSHGTGGSEAGGAAGAAPTGHMTAEGGHSGMTGEGGHSGVPDAGDARSTGGSRPTIPPPTPCNKEADCAPGFNCDFAQGKCTPSDSETCGELVHEASCSMRSDCKVVYAGVNCSCGPDCHCVGGEAGCICQSFEFFRCEPAEPR